MITHYNFSIYMYIYGTKHGGGATHTNSRSEKRQEIETTAIHMVDGWAFMPFVEGAWARAWQTLPLCQVRIANVFHFILYRHNAMCVDREKCAFAICHCMIIIILDAKGTHARALVYSAAKTMPNYDRLIRFFFLDCLRVGDSRILP